jgi:hypothetical protein
MCSELAGKYAKGQCGVAIGGHIRLPNALPGPDKLRVSTIGFLDEVSESSFLIAHNVYYVNSRVG